MIFLRAFGLAALVTGGTALLTAQTQNTFIFQFDESGDASYIDSGAPTQFTNTYTSDSGTVTYTVQQDPFGSAVGQILVYDLPEFVNNGAVGIQEFGAPENTYGDVLWFTNQTDLDAGLASSYTGADFGTQDANLMIFYSEDISTGYLADSGLPNTLYGPVNDVASENADEIFQYLAAGSSPGSPGSSGTNEFDGLSGAPEPASFPTLLIGVAAFGLGAWRRRRA